MMRSTLYKASASVSALLWLSAWSAADLTSEQKQLMLEAYNQCRGEVDPASSNMEKMQWDDDLATVAQNYADECIWSHNSARTTETAELTDAYWYVGENLAVSANCAEYESPSWSVVAWDDEKYDYDYYSDSCEAGAQCGHYTQVAWHNSAALGCGMALCDTMDGISWCGSYGGCRYIVCNYGPGGNIVGWEMYEEGEPCSNCPEDKPYCANNLCSAEPSSETGAPTAAVTGGEGACAVDGDACSDNEDCCSGSCNNKGKCKTVATQAPTNICTADGDICSENEECCSGSCNNKGKCKTIATQAPTITCTADGDICSENEECCSGSCNNKGKCKTVATQAPTSSEAACAADGGSCSDDEDCCSGGSCNNKGKCKTVVTQAPTGVPTDNAVCIENTLSCGSNDECCSGYCNNKNICKTMPTTETPTMEPTAPSVTTSYCTGICGSGSIKGKCWCDSLCSQYGDCCSDACDSCGYDCDISTIGKIGRFGTRGKPEEYLDAAGSVAGEEGNKGWPRGLPLFVPAAAAAELGATGPSSEATLLEPSYLLFLGGFLALVVAIFATRLWGGREHGSYSLIA